MFTCLGQQVSIQKGKQTHGHSQSRARKKVLDVCSSLAIFALTLFAVGNAYVDADLITMLVLHSRLCHCNLDSAVVLVMAVCVNNRQLEWNTPW